MIKKLTRATAAACALASWIACTGSDPDLAAGSDAGSGADGGSGIDSATNPAGPDLWVDPAKGDDAREGRAEAAPVKTIKRALAVAAEGQTVHLSSGIYSEGSGEAWEYIVPRGVVITTLQPGGAVLQGNSSKTGLIFSYGGKLVNVKMEGFSTAVFAETETTDIDGASFGSSYHVVLADQSSTVNITSCSFTGEGVDAGVHARDAAQVRVRKSSFKALKGRAARTAALLLEGFAKMNVVETSFDANTTITAARIEENAILTLVQTTITNSTPAEFEGIIQINGVEAKTATLVLADGVQIKGNTQGIRMSKYGKIDSSKAEIANNGDFGITLDGGTLHMLLSKVTNHAVANIRVTWTPDVPAPTIDLGTQTPIGENELTVTAPSAYGLWIDQTITGAQRRFTAQGNVWSGSPSGELGPTSPNQQELAKVYKLTGNNYVVAF